jgi:hypothetical protein
MITNAWELSMSENAAQRSFELRDHVLVALDHVQPGERDAVLALAAAFARGEVEGTCLPGTDPVFRLHAAPDLVMFARRQPDMPVEILDIVRPAILRLFADATVAE